MGRIKGAGDATFQFNYITPFPDFSKVGEYLYYILKNQENVHYVLCRVISIKPIRYYPDELLSNPGLEPESIAGFLNYSAKGLELYEGMAQIIGYYDTSMKAFINPRKLPKPGDPLYYARNEDLSKWLFRFGPNDSMGAHIGYLMNRLEYKVPVVLDVKSLVSVHLAILAATGAGKSYLVGVIIEEMIKPKNKGAVIIFDPHGEYINFTTAMSHPDFIDKNTGYSPVIKVWDKDTIHIRFSDLELPEIFHILPDLSDKMKYIIIIAWNELYKDSITKGGPNYTAQDFINKLEEMRDDGQYVNDKSSIDAVLWRARKNLLNKHFISEYEHINLEEIIKPGTINIFNLSQITDEDQQLITAVIMNRILKGRMLYKNAKLEDTFENKMQNKTIKQIRYPVFAILEEGHRFAPAAENPRSKKILKTILSEGRKFGVGVGIISQRPGKLDPDILSQCMTQVILRITNPVDQNNIKNSVESVSEDLLKELPGLTTGQAIVVGSAVNSPVLIKVKERVLEHHGASYDVVTEWLSGWDREQPKGKPDISSRPQFRERLY